MVDNIPIFRAKKKDSDEYIIGYLKDKDIIMETIGICIRLVNIDTTTISIHFPNMLASDSDRYVSNGEKDLRIFVSLQEDGKGSDMLIEDGKYDDGFNPIFIPYFRKSSLCIFDLPKTPYGEYQLNSYKILGIQQ